MSAKSKQYPFSVPWENLDKSNLGGINKDKKVRLNQSVNRMNADYNGLMQLKANNGIFAPREYYEYAQKIVESWKNEPSFSTLDRKNTEVTLAEETYVLDREKSRIYWEQNIAAQIFDSVTRALPKFKWDVRQHSVKRIEHAVKFGRKMDKPRYIELDISQQYDKGIGWYVGYQINRFDLLSNEGELFDLQYETMLEASTQMARAANEHILLGTSGIVGTVDALGEAGSGLGRTGMINNANNQSFTTSTLTTYLNIYKGFKAGLADLKTVHATKNVIAISTAGIPDQAESNYPTYGHGDYDEMDHIMRKLVGPSKPIKQWWISDKLPGDTISESNQASVLIALDPRLMNRLIVLPLQTLPVLDKKYDEDISEVMLAADILRFNIRADSNVNAFPVTASTALTTTTTGYRSEERIA